MADQNDSASEEEKKIESKDSEGASSADTENKDGKKDGEGDNDSFNDVIDPNKPPEIPFRRSMAQHIIARQSATIKKLQSKKDEEGEDYTPEESDEDEEDLPKETRSVISKEISKTIAPLLGKLASDADEKELQTLLSTEPEAKGYVNHIKAYMAHDAYKGVSPSVIYHHLAWANSQALGAKKKQAADLEAKQSKGGGRNIIDTKTPGNLPSASDIENMSSEEFKKMEKEVLQGTYKP